MANWKKLSGSWKHPESFPGTFLTMSFFTALFCLLPPRPIASSCDPAPRDAAGYSFLMPEIIKPTTYIPVHFMGFRELYDRYVRQQSVRRQDNVSEWRERFCNIPGAQDIEFIIYKASIPDMEQLRTAIASKSIPLSPVLSNNSFARYLDRNKCTETVDYLIYAKRCEPHVTQRDPWDDTPRNVRAMEDLIDRGLNRFLGIESHYFRLRYAYQMIRLAHYAQQYERTLELYDYLMPKTDNDPSLIEYWIEGHRAGALMALGRNVEASYIYARVFQNCPSRRESALESFRIRTDEEWNACLLLCRDDQERATLYAMRAYAGDSRAAEEMEQIYEYDPANEHLELLLIKEISELEKELLGVEFDNYEAPYNRQNRRPAPGAGEQIIALQTFVRQVLLANQTPKMELWKIAEGYLELLAGDYYNARKTFEQAGELVSDKDLRTQLQVFELVLEISAWSEINDDIERRVANIQRRDDLFEAFPDFRPFLNRKLTYLYQINNRPGKAFLSRYPLTALKPNPQPEIIDDLLRMTRKDDPTLLERQMIEQEDGSTIENELIDMQATLLLNEYQLEAALETLKEIDRTEWDNFGLFNPFAQRINDCVHCLLPDSLQVYNKGELIERMLEMEYQAKANPEQSDILYYRLGVAYYNMSYFSYSWKAMDYYRSGASLRPQYLRDGDNITPHPYYPFDNREHFDCSMALYYFQKARQLTDNPELAAAATFWAAKCERNEYYVNRGNDTTRTYRLFDDLVNRYGNTRFYQRVIEQCETFQRYAAGG